MFRSAVLLGSLLVVFYVSSSGMWCFGPEFRSSDLRFSRDYSSENALDSFLTDPVGKPSLL